MCGEQEIVSSISNIPMGSPPRVRGTAAEAERDAQEARQKAEAEREAMQAEVDEEKEEAHKKIDRSRQLWALSKATIADSAKRQAVTWARRKRAGQKLNLTEREYERQAEAYKRMLEEVLDGDREQTEQALREYANAVGLGDRQDALLSVLTPTILQKTIPPAYFLDMHAGRDYIAYQGEGAIRLCKDVEDWNGRETALRHETGHYFDKAILKRSYRANAEGKVSVTNDPLGIQEAFEEDRRRLAKRRPPVTFRIGNETFTTEEFKKAGARGGVNYASWELYRKLEEAVAEKLNVPKWANEVQEYCGQIVDAIQSVMGRGYSAGHKNQYVTERLNTNIEAIAQITSAIFGVDFLSDIFPNAYTKIKAIYEEGE